MLGYIAGYNDGRNGTTGLAYKTGQEFSNYNLSLQLKHYKDAYIKARQLLEQAEEKNKELEQQYDKLSRHFIQNHVSKDKIKAKIEKYKELDKKEFAKQGNFDVEIGVLQELLKEGEEK